MHMYSIRIQIPVVKFLLVVLFLLLVPHSCSDRDRINPFDPNTDIRPDVFDLQVRSYRSTITLDWHPVDSPDLIGYNIYRARVPEELALYDQTTAEMSQFTDNTGITLGESYVYGVSASGEVDETAMSPLDTITPGNSQWWVLSEESGRGRYLSQFTHDGLHVFETYDEYISPQYIAVESDNQNVYVYDVVRGRVYIQQSNGSSHLLAEEVYRIAGLHYSELSNEVVLVPEENNSVFVISVPSGASRVIELPVQSQINAVTASSTGRIWIAAGNSLYYLSQGTLWHYYSTANSIITGIVAAESRYLLIRVNQGNNLQKIVPRPGGDGRLDTSFTAIGDPVEMKYNPGDQSIWIRNYNNVSDSYSLYRYDGGQFVEMLNGIAQMVTIGVNPVSNVCLAPDYENELIYQIAPDGGIRTKTSPVGKIFKIAPQSLD